MLRHLAEGQNRTDVMPDNSMERMLAQTNPLPFLCLAGRTRLRWKEATAAFSACEEIIPITDKNCFIPCNLI